MNGWTDRWMDGWIDGWIDGWSGWMEWMDGQMNGWIDRRMTSELMDRRERKDGWTG